MVRVTHQEIPRSLSTEERQARQIRTLETQLADCEASYARAIRERAYFRGQAKKWYERNRLLENRIRELREYLPAVNDWYAQEIRAIVKRLPTKPRKKWGERAS